MRENKKYIMGLDISTSTIGISIFEDLGDSGKLKLLHHVTPKIKPKPNKKIEEMFLKVRAFEDFLRKYVDFGIVTVIIEEPLVRSNNVNTVATLLRYNGMISNSVYNILGVVPDYISSYEARKYAFPELMAIRTHDKKGNPYTEAKIKKGKPVLFGAYAWDVDKKQILWEKVAEMEPQIVWLYNKNKVLSKENFDMSDSYVTCISYMKMIEKWK